MSDHLRKQIEKEAKPPKEKEELTKGYEKAKLHEVSVYIARVMRKNQHKDPLNKYFIICLHFLVYLY
jgi:type IV secretory pathway VirD2 relaxase